MVPQEQQGIDVWLHLIIVGLQIVLLIACALTTWYQVESAHMSEATQTELLRQVRLVLTTVESRTNFIAVQTEQIGAKAELLNVKTDKAAEAATKAAKGVAEATKAAAKAASTTAGTRKVVDSMKREIQELPAVPPPKEPERRGWWGPKK